MADRNAPAQFTFEQWRVEFNNLATDLGDISNLPSTIQGNSVTDVIESITELTNSIANGFGLSADSGTSDSIVNGETLTISGTPNEIETEVSGNTIIVGLPTDVTVEGNLDVNGNTTIGGDVTIGGNITIGDSNTDQINISADLNSNLIPDVTNTFDLGEDGKSWRNLYLNNSIVFEGSSDDEHETTLTAINPAADVVLSLPAENGTIATQGFAIAMAVALG